MNEQFNFSGDLAALAAQFERGEEGVRGRDRGPVPARRRTAAGRRPVGRPAARPFGLEIGDRRGDGTRPVAPTRLTDHFPARAPSYPGDPANP